MMTGTTVEEQFDRMISVWSDIPMDGSVSLLTGGNGTGKSFIRQQLNSRKEVKRLKKRVVHISMSLRTQDHGVYNIFTRDTDWQPTSVNTINLLNCASNSVYGSYLVLDEIEVGCSEETLMGVVKWLNENLRNRIKGTLGCLVITHSPHVVRTLNFDHWYNLDGYKTPDEWLNRKIVPMDLDKLQKDSHELFRFITAQGKK